MQNYSSKNTSVNSGKLPAIYGKIDFKACETTMVSLLVDYGCGRFNNAAHYMRSMNWGYVGFDKYWRTERVNDNAMHALKMRMQDITVCSNLLNVIDDEEEIQNIVNTILEASESAYTVDSCFEIPYFFTVYEGNKSGIGKVSKNDCWQRNEPLKAYQKYFQHANSPVYQVHGVITNRPDCLLGVNPDRCRPFAGF